MPYLVSSSVHLLESPQTNCSPVWWEEKDGENRMLKAKHWSIIAGQRQMPLFTPFSSFPLSRRLSLPLWGGLALSSFDPPILIPYSWERECGQIVSDPNSHFVSWKKSESTVLSRTHWNCNIRRDSSLKKCKKCIVVLWLCESCTFHVHW